MGLDSLVLAIGIGLQISFLFTEAFGLTVGGMIVPGYLALNLGDPWTVGLTTIAAWLTFVTLRIVSRHAIIYGRRRVMLTMVIGFTTGEAMRQLVSLWQHQHATGDALGAPPATTMTVVGFVIPGLIALWIDRTSPLQTLSPLLAATSLVHLCLVLAGLQPI